MKRTFVALAAMSLVVSIFPWSTSTVSAAPAGFVNQLLASNLNLPTDLAFAPDGRIFITLKNGQVVVYKNGAVLPTPALSMTIASGGDRGLLSIALDPNFATNQFAYLLYTTSENHERISRFTFSGDTIDPASELNLLENPDVWSGFLNAGTLRYNPVDGKLYATMGSNGLSGNAQDLSSMDGKLLRINLDGSIPADNPFANIQGAEPAIWSYGFRNPWKMNIDPNGIALIGDVGENTWEKIVRSAKGANFGWPMFEGSCLPNCNGVTPPLYVYNHNGAGAAVLGGDIYTGTAFPSNYQHDYFFGDYVNGWIDTLAFDASGNVAATSTFDTGLGAFSDINSGHDGCLYYLTIFPGELHRYCFGNPQPTLFASVSSNVSYGALPLAVQFSSAGSNDSSGAALSYAWNFGDGAVSSAANPSHTYTAKGVYAVTLTVSDANGSANATYKIWADYFPPVSHISAPLNGAKFNDGDTVNYSGNATDPQDGALSPSNLKWTIIYHENTHIDPPTVVSGVSSGAYSIPNTTDEPTATVWYEFDLTATDSIGLSSTTVINIYPNMADLNFTSNPSGAQLILDSTPITAPYTQASVVGLIHTLGLNSPQTINGGSYGFSSWSDGGAQNHNVTTPAGGATYTANFVPQNQTSTPQFTLGAVSSVASYDPGAPAEITATAVSNQNISNVLLDTEVWNASKLLQNIVSPVNLTANTQFNSPWNFTAPTASATYTVKVGLFSSDWTNVYGWDNAATTFSVPSGGATSTPTFTLAATADAASYAPGAAAKVTSTVTANQNVASVNLDTELWGAGGKISQSVQNAAPMNLTANIPVNTLWNLALPTAPGTYTIKVGLFSGDWTKLYSWNDAAATITVTSGGGTPAFADSVQTSAATYNPGAAGMITTNVISTQPLANVNLDTEIFDGTGTKVGQNAVVTSLAANTTSTSIWNFTAPQIAGTYTIKDAVFSSDWTKLYFWDNAAKTFTVGSGGGTTSSIAFVVSASMPSTQFQFGGGNSTITTKVTPVGGDLSAAIDTEVIDPNGNLVLQNDVPVNLVNNQQFTSNWNITVPTAQGTYVIKVGVFSSDYGKLYFWQNRALTFIVGTPPGPPQPGQTYPVNVLQPANGSTVSSTEEIRAVINGLDINTYNIGWRSGNTGAFFNLDTDPITQSYKHAWINFSTWNWAPNNVYPITFQATDANNNVIGSTTISVTVQH